MGWRPQLTRLSSRGACAETELPLRARAARKRSAPDRDGSVTRWKRCPRRARGCPRKSLRPSRDQRVRLLLPGSDGAGHRRIASTPWGEGKQTRKHVLEQDDGIEPYFARSSVAGSSGIGWRLLTMHFTQSSPGADPSFSSSLACSFSAAGSSLRSRRGRRSNSSTLRKYTPALSRSLATRAR